MMQNEGYIPLSEILPPEKEDKKIIDTHIDILLQEDFPVYCINKTVNKKRIISFKLLFNNNKSFWNHKSSWEYYLYKENLKALKEKIDAKTAVLNIELTEKTGHTYGSEYENIAALPAEKKAERLKTNKQKLDEIAKIKNKDKEKVTEVLVDTAKDAALINRAILEEAMRLGDNEAKKLTQNLIDSTHEMVKSSCVLITEDIFSSELMNTLVQKSNGTIVQHMTRVYLNGISFLTYFNNLVSLSSLTQKIRISFPEKYRKFYHTLLPHLHIDEITPERVFLGSIKAIPPMLLHNWATGFLIHDVGKAAAVEYHEGEEKYDRNIVIDHVKLGYKYATTKTNYPMEANMIIGYHHEYYGDSAGYGYFRAYLSQYKKQNPKAKLDYCISYEKEPLLDYQALAYFPAKVLEIIDVYDSVTDPNRVYRKPMEPKEALVMMREEFIEKKLKIDPILFDIFSAFVKEKQLQDGQESPKPINKEELMLQLEQNAGILQEIMKSRISGE